MKPNQRIKNAISRIHNAIQHLDWALEKGHYKKWTLEQIRYELRNAQTLLKNIWSDTQ